MVGPKEAVNHLVEVEMPKHCEVQAGELESERTAVECLSRTKVRTKDAIITIPDEKHIKAVIAAAGISARDRSEVPNLPATSSPDAELRGVSRAAREAIFFKELITRDFGQQCGKPRYGRTVRRWL